MVDRYEMNCGAKVAIERFMVGDFAFSYDAKLTGAYM
jgi:hypothetical protein